MLIGRLYRLIRRLQYIWWWIWRPKSVGVRGLAVDALGRVLLVRHTYLPGWRLPGGGLKRRESLTECARRELREEAGLDLTGPLVLLGAYSNFHEFKNDTVLVYVAREWKDLGSRQHDEIAETRFVDPQALPEGTTPATRLRIEEFLGLRPVGEWGGEPRT